jgi:4-hydroxy-3-polyprenylbenzoate decarboxylase
MLQKPITVAMTGASGSIYGLRLLEFLLTNDYLVDVILSETACKVAQIEADVVLDYNSPAQNKVSLSNYFLEKSLPQGKLEKLKIWSSENLAAIVASGSYRSQGMIIIPSSMGAIGRIANGTSQDLIARCADVCLKERSKLVIVARETPFNLIHLQNMLTITQAGGVIVPAMPAFYHQPKTIDDLVNFVVGKTLDVFGVDNSLFQRWLSK